jgi:tRNA(His) guanylyltransferase
MKNGTDELANRQKEFYESRSRIFLPRRNNTIFRLDGKTFKTYTQGLQKPFDMALVEAMNQTALALCEEIQGAKLAFVQSDEITVFVTDYDTNQTSAWFDYNVQKMVSISAAIATMSFNKQRWANGFTKDALFDSRVFQISFLPEVQNNFLWRQLDCTRNSISTVAQALYSAKELHGKTTSEMQEMIFQKREILKSMLLKNGTMMSHELESSSFNWNDLPVGLKRGRIVRRVTIPVVNTYDLTKPPTLRRKWGIMDAPDFAKNPDFIRNLLDEEFNWSGSKMEKNVN